MPGHLRLPRGTAVAGLTGYGEGKWWVQDISASVPARLLGAGEGRTVLDLCAAPGGKTMQLAAAGWSVTAVDVSESRLARLSENLARTGLECRNGRRRRHEMAAAGAGRRDPARRALLGDRHLPPPPRRAPPGPSRAPSPSWPRRRRRCSPAPPDWLKPGGTLVYSVCSLEPEEGEQVAEDFLAARDDYRLEERQRILPGAYEAEGGADSFFIARFVRNKRGISPAASLPRDSRRC